MKKSLMNLSAGTLLLLSLLFLPESIRAAGLEAGKKAPVWILPSPEGADVKSTDFKGKIVVLNFWATWCPPCVKEIPDFIEIQKELASKNVTFVGVSLDASSAPVKKYLKRTKLNYPVVMGNADVVKDYGNFTGIPHTFVIDKDGVIRVSKSGMISKQALMAGIKPLL